jgi:uncharacterized protein YbjT (DUF2867 family)
MTDREGPVLVIGATGQQGNATVHALLERGWTVNALVRDAGKPGAQSLRAAGARLVTGDLDDPGSLRAAMSAAHRVFLVLTMMAGPKISPEGVVRDIGAFTAIAFDRPGHFIGRTVEIAGDVLTPPEIAETFGRACGLPARFHQVPIEQIRAFDPQLAQMFDFFNERPAGLADLPALRAEHPDLRSLQSWLASTGWKP